MIRNYIYIYIYHEYNDVYCRSAYFRLGHMLAQKVQCRCVLALTATATKATEADVTKVLNISAENVVRDSTVRDNLRMAVTHFNGGNVLSYLLVRTAFQPVNSPTVAPHVLVKDGAQRQLMGLELYKASAGGLPVRR